MDKVKRTIVTMDKSRKDLTLEEIVNNYLESADYNPGIPGHVYQAKFNAWLTGNIEYNDTERTDVRVKAGVATETKTGCGWLFKPMFATKEEALEYWNSKKNPMRRAMHVAYSPTAESDTFQDTRIFTQLQFLTILNDCKLIRAKQNSHQGSMEYGKWGIAIQSFKNSKTKFHQFMVALDTGMTAQEYAKKMYG